MIHRRDFLKTASVAGAALATGCHSLGTSHTASVYELRIYTIHPGKAEALHNRFRNHTLRLFKKHGIESIGYWMPADTADQRLHFLHVWRVLQQKLLRGPVERLRLGSRMEDRPEGQ